MPTTNMHILMQINRSFSKLFKIWQILLYQLASQQQNQEQLLKSR